MSGAEEQERRRAVAALCWQVARLAIKAKQEASLSFEQIDARLGRRYGWSMTLLALLLDGRGGMVGPRSIGALFYAMGREPRLTMQPKRGRG